MTLPLAACTVSSGSWREETRSPGEWPRRWSSGWSARKLADVKDESRAREAIRRILVENLLAEEKLDADARALLLDHAKEIKDSASDYRRLFALVKTKLARERGFTL